ncbi:heavy metal-binding domain-containing protein [Dactylosporangium sp. CS-047395]|uniref:heavy metal-binding domain-containing protein n=1 Tax=Dactylosporangium sp. CS-047395 TaxID=3239936 RepID=UPI003D90ADBD
MTLDPAELGVPQDAIDRLAELKPDRAGKIFTSDLTVNEFLLVKQAGFTPLGLVLGTSVYHCGFQFRGWSRNAELDVLSQAMYHARELAMARMQSEAALLGADGIVAVRLEVDFKEWGNDTAEFLAVGTAVKADPDTHWKPKSKRPFTSDLSGQDFWTLLQAGYAPLGMVMGVCVYHVAHRTFGNVLASMGRNVELPQFTQALYEARELAMARMQHEAEQLGAEGIVGVDLTQRNHSWGSHTTEFFAIGTAVRPLRADHTIPAPQLVLPLD